MIMKLIKHVSSSVVGVGVAFVVRNIVKSNVSTPMGLVGRVVMGIGSVAIAGYVTRKVRTEFEEQFDNQMIEIKKVEEDQ